MEVLRTKFLVRMGDSIIIGSGKTCQV